MKKVTAVLLALLLVALVGSSIFFSATPTGKAMWNNWFFAVQKADDKTNYETRKEVEDACRAMIASYTSDKLTYEQYNAMSGAQQRQVIEMFASPEEFMKWYRAVEAQYKAEHPDIEIGADGVIDAEDLIK